MEQTNPVDGSKHTRPTRRWLRRGFRGLLLVALCAVAANGLVDYGNRKQVCVYCSASSQTREFRLLGIGGQWGRTIELGRLAAFITTHDTTPCQHRWLTCWRESGNVLYRTVQFGASDRATLYALMNTTDLDLEKMQEQDATFVGRLKKAIERPDSAANRPMVEALLADVEAFMEHEVLSKP